MWAFAAKALEATWSLRNIAQVVRHMEGEIERLAGLPGRVRALEEHVAALEDELKLLGEGVSSGCKSRVGDSFQG